MSAQVGTPIERDVSAGPHAPYDQKEIGTVWSSVATRSGRRSRRNASPVASAAAVSAARWTETPPALTPTTAIQAVSSSRSSNAADPQESLLDRVAYASSSSRFGAVVSQRAY